MAISKIHPIRYSVLDCINYIVDRDKTDGELYVSSFACSVHTADLEFAQTADLGSRHGSVKAQHLIQAFAPGEVDAKTAHEIGRKLALELTGGAHEFVIATHIDKDHVHNHIVFNQVSFVDHHKFRQNINTFKQMQTINDTLCASYGLSVITNRGNKARPYYDYKDLKTNNSHRQVLKNTIDSLIPLVSTFDELLSMLNKVGYEIKGEAPSYSVRKETDQRFIRLKNLGDRYTYDAISLRIKYRSVDATPYIAKPKQAIGLLSDLNDRLDKIKNPAYANRVAISEVKRIAATYAFLNEHSITSVSQIAKAQEEWAVSIKEKRDQIRSVEAEIDKLKIICEHLENKEKYNEVYASYLDSGKDKSYKEAHLGQMLMFESSCKILSQMGVSPSVTYKETSDRLNDLIRQKDDLYASYHSDVSNLKQLNIAAKNIDILLSRNETSKSKAKYRNKDERISD